MSYMRFNFRSQTIGHYVDVSVCFPTDEYSYYPQGNGVRFAYDERKKAVYQPGMKLQGTVRNVIDFGAFVDIGVHQDGLVHISEICDRFIKHPRQVLSVGQTVQVVVLDVDEKKKRISLSIKQA